VGAEGLELGKESLDGGFGVGGDGHPRGEWAGAMVVLEKRGI